MTILRALAFFAFLNAGVYASTIQFLDVPTHVNDGTYFALPYEISIDGTPQLVTCYDIYDEVNFGDRWQAQLLSLSQATISGYFSSASGALAKYERVAWLDNQTYSTPAEQIGLQYAIWDVFGTYRSSPESVSYDARANAAASLGYTGYDFTRVRFIEQIGGVPGKAGTKQAFVFWEPPGPGGTNTGSVIPEPRSAALSLLGGLFLAGIIVRERARRMRQSRTEQAIPEIGDPWQSSPRRS